MLNKKIAIYSGEIPSTTFIERLCDGLAEKNTIFLFGFLKKKVKNKSKNIKTIGYNSKFSKIFILLKYTILLVLFDNYNKKRLDKIILKKNENQHLLKIKYYPILFHKPQIFHLQWAKNIEDWIWVQGFGIKLIVSLRGTHITISPFADEKLKENYLKYFPLVHGFHAVSQAIKEEVYSYNILPETVTVIYSGLQLDKFKFELKNSHAETISIISIGRNHWVKGYSNALDCCKILKDFGLNFHYTIIGIDENAEELVFQKAQLDLDDYVTFFNHLPFDKVLKSIATADILLLPSVEEGIANVVLEAMSVGTVVLSTDCGGMNEVITDGINGFLTPIRNPELMAEKVVEISKLTNMGLNTIKKNAREKIENQHGFLQMIDGFETFYHKFCNE